MKSENTNKKQKKKPLTRRQQKFVENMANPSTKTQTEAAIKAGCPPKTARVTASRWLTNANISDAIQCRINRALTHNNVTPEEVIGHAAFNMRSSMDDLLNEQGGFDLDKARETGVIDIVKKLEIKTYIDKETGNKEITHKIEIESPAAARKELASYMNLGTPQQNNINIILTDEDKARTLLKRMVEIHNWSEEKALAGIKERFPEIDETKLLS